MPDELAPCRSASSTWTTFLMRAAFTGSQRPRTSRRLGTEDELPSDSYWVGFTNGAFVYTVDLYGPPGSVSEEQALDIASAYYDRLTGS